MSLTYKIGENTVCADVYGEPITISGIFVHTPVIKKTIKIIRSNRTIKTQRQV